MSRINLFLLGTLFFSCFFFVSFSQKIVRADVDAASLAPHRVAAYRQTENNASTIIGTFLVVRRGFTFDFLLEFDTPVGNLDGLAIDTDTHDLPVKVSQSQQINETVWKVQLTTPNVAPIGNYTLFFTIAGNTFRYPDAFIVLFNPYNPEDSVYFPQQEQLTEYIENEYGFQYRGSTWSHYPNRWYFAQFNPYTLGTAMHGLKSFRGDRSDPVAVSRFYSYFMTIQYAGFGLMWGRWQSPYSGGKEPWYWTGTDQIAQQYVTTGFQTVKYAQCWVFGGVLNSMMRTIGIPSRQLFTFGSGHESPEQGVYHHYIEKQYDTNGRYLGMVHGSVWNFHSWNDIWLNSRKDNAPNGWQALDGTPQEQSEGSYQMGPGALSAIKSREENYPFDIPFVVSEVDATLAENMYNCSISSRCFFVKNIQNTTTGDLIVTSFNGTSTEQDLTWDYKPKRNNSELRSMELISMQKRKMMEGPVFELGMNLPEVVYGDDISCIAKVICINCKHNLETDLVLDIVNVNQKGEIISRLKTIKSSVRLLEKKSFSGVEEFVLSADDYKSLNLKDSSLTFHLSVVHYESILSLQSMTASILPPAISLVVHEKNTGIKMLKIGSEKNVKDLHLNRINKPSLEVMFSFDNPMSLSLKDVKFEVNTGMLKNTFDSVEKVKDENGTEKFVAVFHLLDVNEKMRGKKVSVIVSMTSHTIHSQNYIDLVL